jgi:hypothetical protein
MRVPIGVVKEGERNPEHWFLLIGGPVAPPTEQSTKNFSSDSFGNMYLGGWYRDTSKTSLRKYNSQGTIQFSKIFDRVASEEEWFYQNAFNVSASGNIYTGNIRSSSSPYASRRDPSGSEQWRLTYVSGRFFGGHFVDSSENTYMTFSGFQSPNAMVLSKLNGSGSVLFQRMLRNNSVIDGNGTESADGIFSGIPSVTDSSGNIIIPASRQRNVLNTGFTEGALVVKYNSSGTLQWQKLMLSPNGSRISSFSAATDASNNIYVLINDPGVGGNPFKAIVVKLSPEGSILWQKNIFGFDIYGYNKIHVDASSNCYITGESEGAMGFMKYNSSGTLQLQRFASISSTGFQGVESRLSKEGLILLQSTVFPYIGNKRQMILSLPTDGSVLGTYKIEDRTFTVFPGSFSESEGSLTISNATYLEGSPPTIFGGDPGARGTTDVAIPDTIVKV